MRLVLALPILVVPFLDLACDVSPFNAATAGIHDDIRDPDTLLLVALGWGFFGWIAFAWQGLITARPEPGRHALKAALVAMPIAWAPFFLTAVLWLRSIVERLPAAATAREVVRDSIPFFIATTAACAGLLLAWRLLALGDRPAALFAALSSAFLANAALCLGMFHDEAEIGYFVTGYLFLLWTVELAAASLHLMRNRWTERKEKLGYQLHLRRGSTRGP